MIAEDNQNSLSLDFMDTTLAQSIFAQKFFSHIPHEVRATFNTDQVKALENAFGEQWSKHPLDIRRSFGFWRFKYYFVLIGGREKRDLSRRQERFFRLSELYFYLGFLAFSVLVGLGALYILKSALGIDVFPHYSFGVWDWWQQNVLHRV
ncbi:MAG TPA: 3-phosphoshikimate 1-carboxyvinyltransferase [Gammaproteobacteria bacterium]|nr:3-phosphoshikimate 1-carboxyvinyltransferase [Gammaproteobacteria bacterium]